MDKKLTDNEIIKALECCIKSSHFGECFENQCPLVSENGCKIGKETLYPYALDLINRQKAEIEILSEAIYKGTLTTATQLRAEENYFRQQVERIKRAKAEAYKECIEKVKEKSCKLNMCHNDVVVKTDYQISGEDFDNLLKELVGEDE